MKYIKIKLQDINSGLKTLVIKFLKVIFSERYYNDPRLKQENISYIFS